LFYFLLSFGNSCDWINTSKNRPIGNGRINAHKALLLASGVTNPPDKPEIIGPKNGKVGVEYKYNTSAVTDPEGDDIYFLFDWGDGTYSDWLGPFFSGEIGSATHKWTRQGIFQIRVKARDSYGLESPWSDPLTVTMPKDKAVQNTLFLELLDCFPLLEKILLYLF